MKNFLKQNWILFAVLFLAIFFRFFLINHYPGGLFPDEAANGLDINTMFHGHISPFYPRGNGREALFFYFEALSVLIFGRGVWQFHIVAAAFGVAAVVVCYLLTKRLFDRRTALLATFFMAISSYAATVTRTAFRANMVPFFSSITIFFLVKFFQAKDNRTKMWSAAWAGLFFAAGFYSYTSYRMMLPLVVGFLFLILLGFRHNLKNIWRTHRRYANIFTVAFLLAIAWLVSYFVHNPHDFVGRAGEVSIFNHDLNHGDVVGTFELVVKKTLVSFFTQGDLNWRQNVSGFPFLSPFLSPFFAFALIAFTISLVRLLWQIWRGEIKESTAYQAFLACWFWLMLAPEITTAEGIPHGLRLIGVTPVIFILAAWGINWLWSKLVELSWFASYKNYFAAIFLGSLFVYNFYLFFGVAFNSPDYAYAYRSDLTVATNYLNRRNLKNKTYLALDVYSVQTTDYLTSDKNQPYILLDPAHTYEVKLKPGDQVVFTQSTLFDRLKFLQYHPKARLVVQDRNQFGEIIMLVYQQ